MKRRAVIADTGPLYAAVDPDDAYHKRAQQELLKLARERFEVLVVYPTLLEAYTLVLFRLGKRVAAHWLMEVNDARLINPIPEDYRQAIANVQSFSDQPITLCDATLAAISARLNMDVWTYDHHFDLLHARVWR
jgi:predicted nucleic acid-binding protein